MDKVKKISIDDHINVVRTVRDNQKVQLNKIVILENKVEEVNQLKTQIRKLENALENEKTETDTRFDHVIKRFEEESSAIEDQVESIGNLEGQQIYVLKRLNDIDDMIRNLDYEITTIEHQKQNENNETETNNDNIK